MGHLTHATNAPSSHLHAPDSFLSPSSQLFFSHLQAASRCNKLNRNSPFSHNIIAVVFRSIWRLFLSHLWFNSLEVISQNNYVFAFFYKNEKCGSAFFPFFGLYYLVLWTKLICLLSCVLLLNLFCPLRFNFVEFVINPRSILLRIATQRSKLKTNTRRGRKINN